MAWAPRARTSTTTSSAATATRRRPKKIQDLYLDGKKDEAAALIPDELLDLTNLCGDEGWVQERLQAYKEAGVTNLLVTPIGDPAEVISKVREWLA